MAHVRAVAEFISFGIDKYFIRMPHYASALMHWKWSLKHICGWLVCANKPRKHIGKHVNKIKLIFAVCTFDQLQFSSKQTNRNTAAFPESCLLLNVDTWYIKCVHKLNYNFVGIKQEIIKLFLSRWVMTSNRRSSFLAQGVAQGNILKAMKGKDATVKRRIKIQNRFHGTPSEYRQQF